MATALSLRLADLIAVGSWPSSARALQAAHKFGFPEKLLGFSDIDSPQQRQTRGVIVIGKSPLPRGLKTVIPHVDQGSRQILDYKSDAQPSSWSKGATVGSPNA